MAEIDADEAAQKAVEVAAREIGRLAGKAELEGFDAVDLKRFADICLEYENHRLGWMEKLEPEKLSDELLRKFTKPMRAEADGKPPEPRRARRAS